MKRILSRLLVLSLCLLLSLPTVADAFLGRAAKPEPLSGTYVHSEQQQMARPTQFFELPMERTRSKVCFNRMTQKNNLFALSMT